jgi:hypothetical protein
MTIRLRDATPASERLKPAATEAELRWFRKKRRMALARTMLVTGGMAALYFAGSLLRDPARSHDGFFRIALGLLGLTQVTLIIGALRSVNLVKDVQAKRSAMYEDQRKRIFLNALDDDIPGA